MKLTSDYKIKSIFPSKDAHFKTITGIFLSPNKQEIISASMDSLLMIWNLDSERENLTQTTSTQTKNGPIAHALQDKSGLHFILAHCNSPT